MQTSKQTRWVYILVLVMLGMIGSARATTASTDISDIWWNPNESGWGMQIVNVGVYLFATIYVYGQNGAPTWFYGQLQGGNAATQPTFNGPLYATTGPYFGGSFDPAVVTQRHVGTMTFVLTSVTEGLLTYSVEGNVVNKSVQRTPLPYDNYSGNYTSVITYSDTGCRNPANNGTGTAVGLISINHSGSYIALTLSDVDGTAQCSLLGTYSQLGRMGQVSASASCTDGTGGTATLYEMTNTPRTFTARWLSYDPADGCTEAAEIVGAITR